MEKTPQHEDFLAFVQTPVSSEKLHIHAIHANYYS